MEGLFICKWESRGLRGKNEGKEKEVWLFFLPLVLEKICFVSFVPYRWNAVLSKDKEFIVYCMSTCLLHWKPDVPWKSPVLTTKMVALFFEELTGQPDSLHKWKNKSVSSHERFLVGSQFASKPRDVAVLETRNSGVFLPWIVKSLCSSLFVIIQGFFFTEYLGAF